MTKTGILAVSVLLAATHANGALIDRGQGLIYDDVLDITWLSDANYARTSGYTSENANGETILANGRMDWYSADAWANQLVYGDYDNWRLPTLGPVNGSNFDYNVTYDGSTDRTYNLFHEQSELAYMYYVNLGNIAAFNERGENNPDASGLDIQFEYANGGDNSDMREISNLNAYLYWYDTIAQDIGNGNEFAWAMGTINGMQEIYHHNENPWTGINTFYAWAVHDGDIATPSPVPVPPAILLFTSALLCVFGSRHYQKQDCNRS